MHHTFIGKCSQRSPGSSFKEVVSIYKITKACVKDTCFLLTLLLDLIFELNISQGYIQIFERNWFYQS